MPRNRGSTLNRITKMDDFVSCRPLMPKDTPGLDIPNEDVLKSKRRQDKERSRIASFKRSMTKIKENMDDLKPKSEQEMDLIAEQSKKENWRIRLSAQEEDAPVPTKYSVDVDGYV